MLVHQYPQQERMMSTALLWFRQDCRLSDNPSLIKALSSGGRIIPVVVHSPESAEEWAPGGASRWWLHQSLQALQADLTERGGTLVIRSGKPEAVLPQLAQETGADYVYWSRRYEPWALSETQRVQDALGKAGLTSVQSSGNLMFEPWTIQNKSDKPFQVFSPFWKRCLPFLPVPASGRAPEKWPAPSQWPDSEPLESLGLMPKISWYHGMAQAWQPGEAGALEALDCFLDEHMAQYDTGRDISAIASVSRLSPYLAFGEISPQQIVQAIQKRLQGIPDNSSTSHSGWSYIRQLGWREFSYHLLYHFPHTAQKPLRSEFEAFPWHKNPEALKAWQNGLTGYPIVDAGMRELWTTGWMHNRVRMLVASFLAKDLLIPWQEGAAWFWDTLVDADLANNTMGWQWTAGSGADASPYFRIFNPVLQGEKFDSQGHYVRRWVPELKNLPDKWIHKPWEAPPLILAQARITLGTTYPHPIVDHAEAKARALEALKSLKAAKT